MMLFKMLLHPLQKRCKFHVLRKQTHVLLISLLVGESTLFYRSMAFTHWPRCHYQPTQTNLVSLAAFFHGVVVTLATHVKEGLYHNRYPTDLFFPLAIEVFRSLH